MTKNDAHEATAAHLSLCPQQGLELLAAKIATTLLEQWNVPIHPAEVLVEIEEFARGPQVTRLNLPGRNRQIH